MATIIKTIAAALYAAMLFSLLMGTPVMATESYTWYFVRHAEKTHDKNDPALSTVGQQRALQLAEQVADAGIVAIYSTPYQRTQQTAQPLAERLNITVESYAASAPERLLQLLQQRQQTSLIVGHSNTIPALVRLAGGQANDLTEQQYGDIFVLEFSHGQLTTMRQMRVELP